jgi:MFS family permease
MDKRRVRASAAIGVHLVVDFFSFFVIALMPLLSARLGMSKVEVAVLIGAGSITSGAVQPIVAVLSDRYNTRTLGTIGMCIALVCISGIGFAEHFWQLLALHAIGAAGVGAFHPPAAAAVGALSGRKRSKYMAFFFLAGMTGGVAGNLLSPVYVEGLAKWSAEQSSTVRASADVGFGLRGLMFFLPIGFVAAGVLAWAIHGVSHKGSGASDFHAGLSSTERTQRWVAVGLLYVGNMIRFSVNMALVYLVVEWTTRLATRRLGDGATIEAIGFAASRLNGPLQGAQQVGMGVGGIVFGLTLAVRFEKAAFVLVPWIGAVAIGCIPLAEALDDGLVMPVAFFATACAGLGFGGMVPISLSLAQRLLPHRTSLASGLMLGGAWMVAFLGPQFAGAMQTWLGLEAAFVATGGLLACAGLLAMALDRRVLIGSADEGVTPK